MAEDVNRPDEQIERSVPASASETLATVKNRFTGCYYHAVDQKGRFIVPQAFRNTLGEKIVVGITLALDAIAIYPLQRWEKELNFLIELAELDFRAKRVLAAFTRFSFEVNGYDGQGRVLLPLTLRERFLKGTQDVEVSGAHDFVLVLPQDKADEYFGQACHDGQNVDDLLSDIQNRNKSQLNKKEL